VHLSQGDEKIRSLSQTGQPIASDQTPSGYIGATVVASYDPNKIHSGPTTVVVTGPDDAKAEASFDLSTLR
jgi:hypothetical protein